METEVKLYDTTLRDGAQMEGLSLSVDDKLRILTAMKKIWRERLTTVWPRQGHYALDPKTVAAYPPADLTVERIEDLVNYDLTALLGANGGRRRDSRGLGRRRAARI